MAEEKLDALAARLSVADISTAVAIGLQRAIEARGSSIFDKIIRYGGRLDFNVEVLPVASGMIKDVANLNHG